MYGVIFSLVIKVAMCHASVNAKCWEYNGTVAK